MPSQDTTETKEKIVFYIKQKGPSLPVHIAKEINTSTLFTSAFLSELLSEKKIKASHMRVGTSPVYYVPEHEAKLENFSKFLKSKERESFEILKKEKFLKDSEQLPAIRVALREIKDFAIPFQINEEIIWRYMTIPESEFFNPNQGIKKEILVEKIIEEKPIQEEIKIFEKIEEVKIEEKPVVEAEIESKKIIEELKKSKKIKKIKKTKTEKQNPKFFERIKEFSREKGIEILDIIDFRKGEIVLKVKEREKEMILVAFDKKKISEKEIIFANKKASEFGLNYILISRSEPPKKIIDFMNAIKNLQSIQNIESQNLKTDY